jgi:hypothetical protein
MGKQVSVVVHGAALDRPVGPQGAEATARDAEARRVLLGQRRRDTRYRPRPGSDVDDAVAQRGVGGRAGSGHETRLARAYGAKRRRRRKSAIIVIVRVTIVQGDAHADRQSSEILLGRQQRS